ncbi:MAG: hypothetical protein IPK79_00715 [Vampirovibrionales bacterium]|nr:hypothetical protein [Vampirovibrionales bacterium]
MPWAFVYNGVVMVQSRHSGEMHTNAIGLAELYRVLRASQGAETLSTADFALSTVRRAEVMLPGAPATTPGFELVCIDKRCSLPWGVVANGSLHVVSWHGEKHINSVHVDVIKLLFGVRYGLNGG